LDESEGLGPEAGWAPTPDGHATDGSARLVPVTIASRVGHGSGHGPLFGGGCCLLVGPQSRMVWASRRSPDWGG